MIYEKGFIKTAIDYMIEHPEVGVVVGHTLLPWESKETQVVPESYYGHEDFTGNLDNITRGGYYHCTLIDKRNDQPRAYEQIYGSFFFRTMDALRVGGFPLYLSKAGFRGEMMVQSAIMFSGKKLVLIPSMISWHYSNPYGGLREMGEEEKKRLS